jgi:1-acyl-sn-glycerol-3-phosphate acyltransferase
VSKQPGLLSQKRFGPFFATQALGAFNDNVFKNALVILITYQGVALMGMNTTELVNFAAGIFILPFFLFSSTAGQVADKFEKSSLIRKIKLLEIVIMTVAAVAFWMSSPVMLLVVLFLMGTQSTFFGPIKYSILPQQLKPEELVKGNGLVSMATFLAILLGTLVGGLLIAIEGMGSLLVSVSVISIALVGYLVSRAIPIASPADPDLNISYNFVRESKRTMGFVRENDVVFRAILGASWFWFYGSVMLAQLSTLNRFVLMGNETVATLLLALFSIGIGVGSLLCDRLSHHRVEIGLVPLGSIGLTLFGMDLYFASHALAPVAEMVGATDFMARDGAFRLAADVVLIGMAGGVYIVPLNALIQQRSKPEHRSRVIAGGNILNALFMVISAIYSIALLRSGLSIPELILTTAVINAAVAVYIYLLVPEFLLRFVTWVMVSTLYRVHVKDLEQIPDEGPALLVCNHVSFVDALVIGGSIRRPVRFVMYYRIFNWPFMRWFFRQAKAIPIASSKENPEMVDRAFNRIAEDLEAGELVCIFPEGAITSDGQVQMFRRGVERILERTPVAVVPMGLSGLWGSFFSRSDGGAMRGPMRKLLGRLHMAVGEPLSPEEATADRLRERVLALMEAEDYKESQGL